MAKRPTDACFNVPDALSRGLRPIGAARLGNPSWASTSCYLCIPNRGDVGPREEADWIGDAAPGRAGRMLQCA